MEGLTVWGNRHGGQCVWPLLITPATDATASRIVDGVAAPGGSGYTGPGTTRSYAAGATVPRVVVANTGGAGVPA